MRAQCAAQENSNGPQNIPLGRNSCYLAAFVWLWFGAGHFVKLRNLPYYYEEPAGQLVMTCWFFMGLGMAALGVALAIGGLMQTDHKKLLAVLGGFLMVWWCWRAWGF